MSILTLSVKANDFIVYYDVSYLGLGVELQERNVIDYAFKKLKVYDINDPTHYLELEVVMFALKIWYIICTELSMRYAVIIAI